MDIEAGEWVEDPGDFEEEELGWVDIAAIPPGDAISVSKVEDVDDCNYSLDELGNNNTNVNDDL
ncbi:hypothetical protein BVC80_1467g24 [Macleaya cordata]|uniref:Uncharacterized protein n=1 Tax=Macleaya cordata TaxID=56857 RepID=A0A200PV02_MACCD|nr:hypothetical protein BVC80_1467g24 [Macleaya cordata]